MTWVLVIFLSIILAVLWQYFSCVVPAMRRANVSEYILNLERCILDLNSDALLNGKIKSGSYLHGNYYLFLLSMLSPEKIKMPKISDYEFGQDSTRRMSNLDIEINSLDANTKESVLKAMLSISMILLYKYPLDFAMILLKMDLVKSGYKNGLVRSGKLVSVTSMS
jgi:hypothetical protein